MLSHKSATLQQMPTIQNVSSFRFIKLRKPLFHGMLEHISNKVFSFDVLKNVYRFSLKLQEVIRLLH